MSTSKETVQGHWSNALRKFEPCKSAMDFMRSHREPKEAWEEILRLAETKPKRTPGDGGDPGMPYVEWVVRLLCTSGLLYEASAEKLEDAVEAMALHSELPIHIRGIEIIKHVRIRRLFLVRLYEYLEDHYPQQALEWAKSLSFEEVQQILSWK